MEIEQPQNYCAFVKRARHHRVRSHWPSLLFFSSVCTCFMHTDDTVKITKHVVDHLSVFSTAMIFVLDRKVKGKGK